MALNKENFLALAKVVANANPSSQTAYSYNNEQFSYADLNETLRKEFNEIAGTYELYRQNKNLVFELIEQTLNDVLPAKVIAAYGQFAEVKTFAQGDKPVFVQRITEAARRRAKQFVTKVGLAGVYEVFKLDSKSYEVPTSAIGTAAQIGFEEFLDGRYTFDELLNIVREGMNEAINLELERALIGAVAGMGEHNKASEDSFVESEMDRLLSVADSYGKAAIYCTYEFAATMVPANGWVSDEMRNERWAKGFIANYKGHSVIILPQSYEDETNAVKVIDPSYAFIIPSGADKPVKVAFEGETHAREAENHDWSRDIHIYRKVGVAAIVTNNICVYRNTSLER